MSDPNQPTSIKVTVHGARDLYATNLIGKMDPYVVVTMGSHTNKSNVDNNGGKTPSWNQTFVMPYSGEQTLRFTIYDKDKLTADDCVGVGDVALNPLVYGTRHMNSEIPITRREGKAAGFIRITVDFEPKAKQTSPATNAAPPAQGQNPYPAGVVPSPQYGYPPQMVPPGPYGLVPGVPNPHQMLGAQPYGHAAYGAPTPGFSPPGWTGQPQVVYAPSPVTKSPRKEKKKKKSKHRHSSSSSSSD